MHDILMKETKAGKYGRNLAIIIKYAIKGAIPKRARKQYREAIAQEISNWRFADEFSDIDEMDITNPRHVGKLIKQGANLMYNKNTGKNALDALLKEM